VDEAVQRRWDTLLYDWLACEQAPLLIRKSSMNRGTIYAHPSGRAIVLTDNAPANWALSAAVLGMVPTLNEALEALRTGTLPVTMAFKAAEKKHAVFKGVLSKMRNPPNLNLLGWKVCHIDGVAGEDRRPMLDKRDLPSLKEEMRRLLSPSNMFVVHKERGGLTFGYGEQIDFIRVFREARDTGTNMPGIDDRAYDYLTLGAQFLRLANRGCSELVKTGNKRVIYTEKPITNNEISAQLCWSDHGVGAAILFNFFHGIELTLKAFLALETKPASFGHRFTELLKEYERHFPDTDLGQTIGRNLCFDKATPLGRFLAESNLTIDDWYQGLKYPESKGKSHEHFYLKFGGSETIPFWVSIADAAAKIGAQAYKLAEKNGSETRKSS
jgi:hypothetical protein